MLETQRVGFIGAALEFGLNRRATSRATGVTGARSSSNLPAGWSAAGEEEDPNFAPILLSHHQVESRSLRGYNG